MLLGASMPPSYYIYLLTFLGYPILSLVLHHNLNLWKFSAHWKWIFGVFAIHNVSYYYGLSIKCDYPDYIIFSLEYLFFCLTIFSLSKSSKRILRISRVLGIFLIVVGFLQGLVGTILFIVVAQDFEADKVYCFKSGGNHYVTRRYSFGFATLDDTRYNFDTYRTYKFLPF